ncbi:hypothetical protein EYF80_026795 [Liparis tanakae]|uniref:Uncharacterized protein n=1 Tax=Liparis tanakae TaxID=230148 RepID=A0A4Z2HB47_9TELE|nr:hypothetical protein EYF80_026795 [Liparis tanakae]
MFELTLDIDQGADVGAAHRVGHLTGHGVCEVISAAGLAPEALQICLLVSVFCEEDTPLIVPKPASLQALARGLAVRIMRELSILPSTVSLARWERNPACVA